MAGLDRLAGCIGGALGRRIQDAGDALCEVRIRANRPARLRLLDGSEIASESVNPEDLRRMLARMTGDSLYACEDELRQGYFTMAGGFRVGVCGRLNAGEDGLRSVANAASLCIRIPREIPGCAEPLYDKDRPPGLLLLSPPGMGKTTLIRDYARLLSDGGKNVAIADERREIAACVEGVPSFDVGCRTDVMDGCPKALAIPLLLRACAPDVIVADEIGGAKDEQAILDALRCGVSVAATAHASGFDEAYRRFGRLMDAGVFLRAVLLGGSPGKIIAIREYGK